MATPRASPDHVAAAVWAVGGLGVAIWAVLTGLPGWLVALVLVGFGLGAWSSWRRAASASAPAPAPVTVVAPGPPEPPVLSPAGRAEVARVVAVLDAAGLFAPRVPDPADLAEGVADAGEPVTVDTVLFALWEAEYWHPGFRADDHLGALACHHRAVEQGEDTLREHVEDLARLLAGDVEVRLAALELTAEGAVVRTRGRLVVGGRERQLDYRGRAKALSTVVHVTVARTARAAGASARLAWLDGEQGVWLAALRGDVTVDGLNADLGFDVDGSQERWAWVDEQEPEAAGDG